MIRAQNVLSAQVEPDFHVNKGEQMAQARPHWLQQLTKSTKQLRLLSPRVSYPLLQNATRSKLCSHEFIITL